MLWYDGLASYYHHQIGIINLPNTVAFFRGYVCKRIVPSYYVSLSLLRERDVFADVGENISFHRIISIKSEYDSLPIAYG